MDGEFPPPPSDWKARWLAFVARLVGEERVYRQLETVEREAVAGYGIDLKDAESARIAAEAQADERQHALALRASAPCSECRSNEIESHCHQRRC